MDCRPGCGACCIAPSIAGEIPGMPAGKPAGIRCVNLDNNNYCELFGQSSRPVFCQQFTAELEVCGETRSEAMDLIQTLELVTGS